MIFSFHKLHVFFSQSVSPVSFLDRELSSADFIKWKSFLQFETDGLILAIKNNLPGPLPGIEKKNSSAAVQSQLVILSDQINSYLFRQKKVWATHRNANQIRTHYLYSLSRIEEILDYLSSKFPEYYNNEVKLTDFSLMNILPELRHLVFGLKEKLKSDGIQEVLYKIVFTGLYDLLSVKRLNRRDLGYLTELVFALGEMENMTERVLIRSLISYNFNQPDLFLLIIEQLDDQLANINGLHEQLELVFQMKKDTQSVGIKNIIGLHPGQETLKADFQGFFVEKVNYLEELLVLRRVAIKDKYESGQAFRLLVRLSVPQLALFFRVLMESGLLAKQDIREVFNFVAQHFYTDKTSFISSQNMLIKSSNVEFSSAVKIYDMLKTMMQWLDEKFNVKDYQH